MPNPWPGLRAVLACCFAAALAIAVDAYFSAQDGYLSRPPDYDGVSYLTYARAPLLLLRSLHVRAALHDLVGNISPLWIWVLTTQQLILGDGSWQAFSARFWAVALLLILVYWIVSRRGTRSLAVAAVVFTALLPLVSAGVRASSVEFLSGQASYVDHWYLDDLRPDFLAIVLILWSVAALAEHIDSPRRSAYLVSAAFAATAVLAKSSTAPVALAAWGATLAVSWLWNRRNPDATRMTLVAPIFLAVLLLPWAVFGGGVRTVVAYLGLIVAQQAAYTPSGGIVGGWTYFAAQIPGQLGPIEAWVVIAGALVLTIALVRRRLGRAELIYAAFVPLFYVLFSLPPSKSPFVGESISLSIWLFFWAGLARIATARWPVRLKRASPYVLAAVSAYTLIVLALGSFALANWPANEQRSNAQLLSVTTGVAGELGRHVSATDCFAYAPGPGWPASIISRLIDSNGNAPASTAIDVVPSQTSVSAYVAAAGRCTAVMSYREDITDVARIFFAPPVRQPYLRAVAQWVRSPDSGYVLDRSWSFTDLASNVPHPLGRYQGVSLTLDLYLRSPGP